jgi:type IV pilus assembly protein PilA
MIGMSARRHPWEGHAVFARIRTAMAEREEGFTLIELLVVIIIIGILAAIAIPVFLAQRSKGYDAGVKSDLRNLATAEESWLTDNPSSYASAANLVATSASGQAPLVVALSNNDTVHIYTNAANGYCMVGNNTNSTSWFEYTNTTGGLNNSPVSAASAASYCTGAGFTANGTLTQSGGSLTAS